MDKKWASFWGYLYAVLLILFILAPFLIILPVSFGTDMFQFPPQQWTGEHYQTLLHEGRIFQSLGLSLMVGLLATLIASMAGLCAGLGVSKGRLPGKGFWESFFLGPLIVPMVTTGIGFLIFFQTLGMTGSLFSLVLAHSVIIFPYVVRITIAALRQFDPTLEEAALIHGAKPWYAFVTVVLPQLTPSLIAGALLAFLVSLDEYTVTVFLAQAESITLPIRIYQFVSNDINPVVTALASFMVVLSFIMLAFLERRFHIHRYLEL